MRIHPQRSFPPCRTRQHQVAESDQILHLSKLSASYYDITIVRGLDVFRFLAGQPNMVARLGLGLGLGGNVPLPSSMLARLPQ